MKIVSFIPIKLNNQRLPGKNTMLLNGRPTCDYIFETISNCKNIDEKYIYCSDEAIKPYIAPYEDKGLRFLKRDTYLDGFQVKGLEIIERFVKDVDADIYVLTHVTQPFTKTESIEKALDKVISGEYDSAFSAVILQDYMWMNGKPFNYDMKNIVRTQDLEPIYMETGAFFIFRKEVFTKLGQRIGNKPYIYEIDQFENEAQKEEFAEQINNILRAYKEGYYLEPTNGFIMQIPNGALREQLEYDGSDLPDSVYEQLATATEMYYRFDANLEQKKKAINILADILESEREEVKDTLNAEYEVPKNEHDKLIFGIVNGYNIRHNRADQKNDYSKEIWYDWMMQYYTSVIIAFYKLKNKHTDIDF